MPPARNSLMINGANDARKVLFVGVPSGAFNYSLTVESAIALTITSKLLVLAVLFSALAISTFVVIVAAAQVSPVEHALQTGEKAYAEMKAADRAGANVTALAVRFNAALGLLEDASRLEKAGDETAASTQASQAEHSFLAITQDAQSLMNAAVSRRQQETTLRYVAIPVTALIVAGAAVALLIVRRRVQSRQFTELRIKAKAGD